MHFTNVVGPIKIKISFFFINIGMVSCFDCTAVQYVFGKMTEFC